MKHILTKSLFLSCAAMAVLQADAQVYPYFADFESDSIKAYASPAAVDLNGISWTMPGVYLGDMETSDRKHGQHAARVRLTNNTTGDNGTLTMESDLSQGIDTISFYHAMYGSETGGTLEVYYSTNQGGSWTQAGGTITPGNTLTRTDIPINISGPVRVSIRKTDGTNARINVDDIMITGRNGYATNVIVTGKTPVGRNIPLSTDTLTIKFNHAVSKGTTGNIVLHNITDASDQTIAVTSSDVAVNGPDVQVSGITLGSGKRYYVTFDSAAFTDGTLNSTGIYTDNIWTFSSVDTSTRDAMNETFADCNEPAFGAFSAFSATGGQTWKCGSQGHTDSKSVYMNGGFAGGANDNEDWLISTAALDLSTVSNPALSFWTKVRYSGATTKQVLVSSDYSGTGSPAGATWQLVEDITNGISDSNSWVYFDHLSLDNYKSAPFYLAFKYVSQAAGNGAQEWSLDDITVEPWFSQAVRAYKGYSLDLQVLGQATSARISLAVAMPETGNISIGIYDLTGRKVYEQPARMQAGNNICTIANTALAPGMYVIRAGNDKYYGTVKAVVQ